MIWTHDIDIEKHAVDGEPPAPSVGAPAGKKLAEYLKDGENCSPDDEMRRLDRVLVVTGRDGPELLDEGRYSEDGARQGKLQSDKYRVALGDNC